jgi:hypothetical protein
MIEKLRFQMTKLDRKLAESIMSVAISMGNQMNELSEIIGEIPDAESRQPLKEATGYLMGYLTDIVFLIERDYPDLSPDA